MVDDRWHSLWHGGASVGDAEAHHRLVQIARNYAVDGNALLAGFAYEGATRAAWGDPSAMASHFGAALDSYLEVVSREENCSLIGIAALLKLRKLRWQSYLAPSLEERLDGLAIADELAQRITSCFGNTTEAESYLVRGVEILIGSDGLATARSTSYEVDESVETGGRDFRVLGLPSAFRLFVEQADYLAARDIANTYEEAFTSPGLRGWRHAVLAFTDGSSAADQFSRASSAFAEDVPPEDSRDQSTAAPYWSGINAQLWAPYFAARAYIAEISNAPDRARELIQQAAAAFPLSEVHWVNPRAIAFARLIESLNKLLSAKSRADVEEVRSTFTGLMWRLDQSADSELVRQFVNVAAESFEGFYTEPATEVSSGRLHSALDLLKRLPLLDAGVADAVAPALGQQALSAIGGQLTWIYRTLERITDEGQLQRIVLRLVQSGLPSYAQIVHGPLEYGKDVVVAFQTAEGLVLRMYQVKVGDISTPVWSTARREMEDMFLVPLSEFQTHGPVIRREGILLCNGHCKPHVQPVLEGWFAEQRRVHGRVVDFMHLDDLVRWVTRERLVTDLRGALQECGVAIVD